MKTAWFRRSGLFYVPANPVGWIVFLVALVYAVYVFIDIDSRSHSVSDTLINFAFNLLLIGAVYTLIGWLSAKLLRI
ncbi:MAG TPA: hypothetical protein VFW78_12565 [Bacteroidia bacterium]|nr:hypothetical protein [Bacteroidia bacterium]